MKTNTDVTLYSRTVSGATVTWTRSVIPGVQWEDRKAENVVRSGLLEADRAAVYIPLARGASIQPGDILARGVVTKVIGEDYAMSTLRATYRTIEVRSVDTMDFGSPSMQHLQVGGG